MSTTTSATLMTAEQLLRHPDDGFRYELVGGELRQMVPAGGLHGVFGINVAGRLFQFVYEHNLGRIFLAETGFVLGRNPDTVLAPDVAFVAAGRLPDNKASGGGLAAGFVDIVPDLVVEVVSPSDTLYEVEEKVQAWLTAGTQAVWIVNPKRRSVTVHTAAGSVTLTAPQILDGGSIVPGFTLPVADVFA